MTFALQTRFSLFFHDLCFAGELQTLACGLGLRKYRYRIVIHCFVTNPEYENSHLTERQISRIFYDDLYSRSTPTKSLYSLSLPLSLLYQSKRPNNEQSNEHKTNDWKPGRTKSRLNKIKTCSMPGVSAISCQVISRKSLCLFTLAGVISAKELGTLSKN